MENTLKCLVKDLNYKDYILMAQTNSAHSLEEQHENLKKMASQLSLKGQSNEAAAIYEIISPEVIFLSRKNMV